jgi:hypothetical protein
MKFEDARRHLREGDVLLFRGGGLVSHLIKRAGEGNYSHVAVASAHKDNGHSFWECVEFREWRGGRTVNLERYVQDNPGLIDVYRACDHVTNIWYNEDSDSVENKIVPYNGKAVTNMMRRMTGLPYGWKRIYYIATRKMPFLRWFYSIDSIVQDDPQEEAIYPVCSTAMAHAYNKMGYDLLHNRSDAATEPSDVSRSPLLHYIFTLTP